MGALGLKRMHVARAFAFGGVLFLTPSNLAAGTVTYAYDPIGRLASAAYPDGTCVAYTYDLAGNRKAYNVSGSSAPIANPVSQTVIQDVPTAFDPRLVDPSCGGLTIQSAGTPSHGSAVVNSGASITYTPSAGYTGTDSFSYTVSNGSPASSTVTINVIAPTLSPVALNGVGTYEGFTPPPVRPVISLSVAPLVSDPYGYPLTITSVTQGVHGAVTFSGLNVTYTYPGTVSGNILRSDAFKYTVSDGHSHTATATISVTVEVSNNQ
jgi:YD repeat-containing protein